MTHLRQLPVSKDMASQNLIHHSRFHRAFWSIWWTGNTTYSTIATCLLIQPGNGASTCWRCGFKPGGGHFNCVNIGFPMDTWHEGSTGLGKWRKLLAWKKTRWWRIFQWFLAFLDVFEVDTFRSRFGVMELASAAVRKWTKPTKPVQTSRQTIESSLRLLKAQLFWDFNFWSPPFLMIKFPPPLCGPACCSRLLTVQHVLQIATAIFLHLLPTITSFFTVLIQQVISLTHNRYQHPNCFPHILLCQYDQDKFGAVFYVPGNHEPGTQRRSHSDKKGSGELWLWPSQQGKWQSMT